MHRISRCCVIMYMKWRTGNETKAYSEENICDGNRGNDVYGIISGRKRFCSIQSDVILYRSAGRSCPADYAGTGNHTGRHKYKGWQGYAERGSDIEHRQWEPVWRHGEALCTGLCTNQCQRLGPHCISYTQWRRTSGEHITGGAWSRRCADSTVRI